jgi:hypothetical protein
MDWFSRRVLSWRLSITMETDFCVDALREAMDRHGRPEIFNTDQGVQFTSAAFLDELSSQGVRISMDGKGRFLDNIFIERLWRSLKYEEVYIKAYDSVAEARQGIGAWFGFYNGKRPHQALDYRTPRAVHDGAACEYVDNGRVGTEDYSSVPLTEPYVRVTHTAPWIDRSDPSTSWADTGGSRVASVTPAPEPVVFLFLALCGRRLRRPDASGGSVVPPPEGLSANARPNCRGPVFLNPSLPSLRRLSPVSPLL